MNSKFPLSGSFLFFVIAFLFSCEKEIVKYDTEVEIQQLILDHDLPSVSACVFRNNEIVWSFFSGYSDKENLIQATDKTIYHIGSISKLFIVTAMMQLEEQGLIDLDQDINHYLPIDFRHPGYPDIPITARVLLTHRAGLAWPKSYNGARGMWFDFEPDTAPSLSEWIPDFLIPAGSNYDPHLWKAAKPGKYEYYSNIGSCIVAYLVEQVSGQNFRDYCMDHIFIPLKMHSTSYNYADLNIDAIAVLYENRNKINKHFDDRVYAAGGLKTNVLDLSRFAMAYMNGGTLDDTRILKASTIDKILEIQNEASGRCLIWQAYLGDWFGHIGGLDKGTATTLEIIPKNNIGFIIFTNTLSPVVHPGNEIYGLVKQKANEHTN